MSRKLVVFPVLTYRWRFTDLPKTRAGSPNRAAKIASDAGSGTVAWYPMGAGPERSVSNQTPMDGMPMDIQFAWFYSVWFDFSYP